MAMEYRHSMAEHVRRHCIWLMNGASVTPHQRSATWGPTWSIVGLGDFNDDGRGDILWRNTANDLGIWLMNGTIIMSAPTIGNATRHGPLLASATTAAMEMRTFCCAVHPMTSASGS